MDDDIVIVLEGGLKKYEIGFIQETEKILDAALLKIGFSRTRSDKTGERIVWTYWQFAVGICEKEN